MFVCRSTVCNSPLLLTPPLGLGPALTMFLPVDFDPSINSAPDLFLFIQPYVFCRVCKFLVKSL